MLASSSTAPSATGGAVPGYHPPPGVHDEMAAADGSVRPHWQRFLEKLLALGPAGMERCWDKARHLIHENGVSYNVHGDPRGLDRPWPLAPLPVMMSPAEWSDLVAAMAQRARLLELILEDLYGPQRAVARGLIPPALVFGHPASCAPVRGSRCPRDAGCRFTPSISCAGPTGA